MDSVLKRLFSFLWWIYNPYSGTYHQILGLWNDVELGFLLLSYLLIAYDLPVSPISVLKYWPNRTEIVTVSRMFLDFCLFLLLLLLLPG